MVRIVPFECVCVVRGGGRQKRDYVIEFFYPKRTLFFQVKTACEQKKKILHKLLPVTLIFCSTAMHVTLQYDYVVDNRLIMQLHGEEEGRLFFTVPPHTHSRVNLGIRRHRSA